MSKEWILAAFVVIALIAVCAVPAIAQDEDEDEGAESMTWMDTIMASGVIGGVIILLSIVSLALVIEHFVSIRQDKLVPPEILGEIEVLFEDEEYEEAMELCEAEPSYFTNVVGAALPKMGSGYHAMMDAIADSLDEENTKLHQKISYISLIAAVAPMLGLLGTVYGMIIAFQKIAASRGAPEPAELASGISLALVTTFEGLIVAIPATAFYFFFRNKVVGLGLQITTIVEDLFDRFRPTE
ncbi:MAG: MotA/TolQ/ExbB proton channel family protein [Planctomycetota bacterium]|jgi:biopolymer transport protein ExbB